MGVLIVPNHNVKFNVVAWRPFLVRGAERFKFVDRLLLCIMPISFCTTEGVDGSGKSTVMEAITEHYPNAVTTSEPSEMWTGKQVRRCLSDESIDPLTDFYFFMGDRVHHIQNTVVPAVRRGGFVISDRYADSTRAYQPVALAESEYFETQAQAKFFIEQTMDPWNYEPELTLYIDVSVDTAIERCDEDEKYEKREFLEEVKKNYDALAETQNRIVRIDGEQSKEGVKADALAELDATSFDRT